MADRRVIRAVPITVVLTIVVVARAHCGQGILLLMIGGALHAGLDEQKASMDGRAPSHWTVVLAGGEQHRARAVVLGVGSVPTVPDCALALLGA